jgi:hypothetical protein
MLRHVPAILERAAARSSKILHAESIAIVAIIWITKLIAQARRQLWRRSVTVARIVRKHSLISHEQWSASPFAGKVFDPEFRDDPN